AGMTGLGLGARLRPRTLAGGTALPRGDTDLGGVAIGGLLERDLHGVAQVGAVVDVVASAAGATGAEDVAEDVAEDIRETTRPGAAAREAPGAGVDAGMADAIVGLALGRPGQDLVGLLGLLELALGRLVGRIAVGMVFHRELPIGLLQVIGGRVLRYPEYIVEATLGHR